MLFACAKCPPTVHNGKSLTCCNSLPACNKSFLTRKEYAICRLPRQIETHSLGYLEGLKMKLNKIIKRNKKFNLIQLKKRRVCQCIKGSVFIGLYLVFGSKSLLKWLKGVFMRKKVANAKGYIYCDQWALSIQPKIPNHSIGLVVGLAEGLYSLPPKP